MVADSKEKIILYCHNLYNKAGGENKVFADDVELLRKEGIKVITYTKNNAEIMNTPFLKKFFFILFSLFNPFVFFEVRKIVKKHKITIAIIQNTYLSISPSIYFALTLQKIPIIQMVYNYRFVCPNAHLYIKGSICEKCINGNYFNAVLNNCRESISESIIFSIIVFLKRKIFRIHKIIDHFVVPDSFLKKKLIKGGIQAEKISVVKNPFSFEITPSEIKYDSSFLYVGRLVRQKGIFTILHAARNLPNVKFRIIGGGPLESEISDFIGSENLKNVDFLGELYGDDMFDYLMECSCLIVPSEWYDNYPVIVSLAYFFEKPVIASEINGLPEVVINKVTGLLFETKNASDLSAKIMLLKDDLELTKLYGKNGKEFLMNRLDPFTRVKMLNNIMANYAE